MAGPKLQFEPPRVSAKGTFKLPPLTADDLAAIQQRADGVEDKQTKDDLFRLIHEVHKLQTPREPQDQK